MLSLFFQVPFNMKFSCWYIFISFLWLPWNCRERSSHQRCSVKKLFLVFFNKAYSLLKKSHWHWCFFVNFAKFLRTPFLQNTSGRLLLQGRSTILRSIRPGLLYEKPVLERKGNTCGQESTSFNSQIVIY